ncbi:hypothetical protein AVEN_221491-1 [Araneus ventricosus]|uniref:Uncharacterized protein n=1 Tax=Araneus ventricosus TaxID=182803 RepID=A0A4Y2DZX2_ARAVE|nr:hypothetical protein AVEN_221491-1 [Araneus ventricosus]
MAPSTMQEKAYCVLELAETSSVSVVQRHFHTKFGKEPPHRHNIVRWVKQLEVTGCLCKKKSPGRTPANTEVVETIRESFLRSPSKSTRLASAELQVPHIAVWRVLRKGLQFKPYAFQMVQALKPSDKSMRKEFCVDFQAKLEEDGFANRFEFTDEATFHLCGKVNRHNLRFGGTESPHRTIEYQRDSPKVNVFCAITNRCVFGPFFFMEKSITGYIFQDMLSEWLFPQLEEVVSDFILQVDGAAPHWHNNVREYLSDRRPHRWIGSAGANDMSLLCWPARSSDLTP